MTDAQGVVDVVDIIVDVFVYLAQPFQAFLLTMYGINHLCDVASGNIEAVTFAIGINDGIDRGLIIILSTLHRTIDGIAVSVQFCGTQNGCGTCGNGICKVKVVEQRIVFYA